MFFIFSRLEYERLFIHLKSTHEVLTWTQELFIHVRNMNAISFKVLWVINATSSVEWKLFSLPVLAKFNLLHFIRQFFSRP